MKPSQRRPSLFINLLLFAGLVAVWVAFAPASIGGQASYVMVSGISMEPGYHSGDLVIIRQAQDYRVGEVVTYRDAKMNAHVIHRIIGIEQDHYILQGDNNSWIDSYHPTREEIIGSQWVYAPKLGLAMQWLRKPINLSLTVVLLGGLLMTGMLPTSPKGQKKKKHPSTHPGGMLEGTLTLLVVLLLGFIGLAIFAFTRPLTRAADSIPYQQESNYIYSAAGTPGVYDTGMVRSGEPIFPRLTCFLNIGFTYNLPGNQLQGVSGNYQMYARVMDAQSGWQRTIPLIPQTAFTGNSFVALSSLDLCQLASLVAMVEKETGLHANSYTVEITTNVAFLANASGQAVTDTFDPTLAFKFDQVHLYLADKDDPMKVVKPGLVGSAGLQDNTLSILGREIPVASLRTIALLGLGVSFLGLGILGLFVFNTAFQSEETLIRLRYGSLLMDVVESSPDAGLSVIDVASIDDLAKLAERQNSMILHVTRNSLHSYLVQGNGATYCYRPDAAKSSPPEKEAPRREVAGYLTSGDEYVYEAPRPIRREVSEYVISLEKIPETKSDPDRTGMFRKIRI